jgi:hypothetical protein
MTRKRFRTTPPPAGQLPAIFSVKAEDRVEANQIERDAWQLFLKWCSQVPQGTKVELLRHDKVIARLTAAGTPSILGLRIDA